MMCSCKEIYKLYRSTRSPLSICCYAAKPDFSMPIASFETCLARLLFVKTSLILMLNECGALPGLSELVAVKQPSSKQSKPSLRHFVLSNSWIARDEWSHFPLSQIGLSMRFDSQLQMFRFEMSPDYLKMQEHFEAASMTFDPQSLMDLLQFQPWHCDTLIQMVVYIVETAVSSLSNWE